MKQIFISGVIGWDATPGKLREELQAAAGDDVELIISSPGGFVSDGIEMFNLVRNYKGQTTARLSGYAMSMASYIPLAANRIVAEDNAIYMIHNVRGGVFGDHNEILRYGNTTKAMSGLMARAYMKRTGKDQAEIEKMMDDETYFFGQDMVDEGFVDEIIETGEEPDQESARAIAMAAFEDCSARMVSDQEAVRRDMKRAAVLTGGTNNNQGAQAKAEPAQTSREEAMNLEKLKADHPELVAAIIAEAVAEMISKDELQTQLATARTEGAAAENQRIASVRAQAIPGHEALVEQMAFDGKSTAADVALAIVAAEKTKAAKAAADLDADANDPAPPAASEGGDGKSLKRKEFDALDQQARRAFLSSGGKIVA